MNPPLLHFAHPWLLVLLPVVWGLALLPVRRSFSISQLALFAVLRTTPRHWLARLGYALENLAMSLVVVASSGASIESHATRPIPLSLLMVVLDTSGSIEMVEAIQPSGSLTRLDLAKRTIESMLGDPTEMGPTADEVGIVVFANNAQILAPPSADRRSLRRLLQKVEANRLENRTNIGDGLVLALSLCQRAAEPPSPPLAPSALAVERVILFSDGGQNVARGTSVGTAAAMAAALEIPVDTVLVGTPKSREDAESQQEGERTLEQLATISGGVYARLEGLDQQAVIDRLQMARHATSMPQRLLWPLAPSLVLVAACLLVAAALLAPSIRPG